MDKVVLFVVVFVFNVLALGVFRGWLTKRVLRWSYLQVFEWPIRIILWVTASGIVALDILLVAGLALGWFD